MGLRRTLLLLLPLAGCGEPDPAASRPHPVQAAWGEARAELYGPCASCHLADATGRPDGTIPRLAGQRASVLRAKLHAIRDGEVELPVMAPFASALTPDEIDEVADWLAALPAPSAPGPDPGGLYAQACAACHGPDAAGRDEPPTPALCGQHAGYLSRRLSESAAGTRVGDAAMAAVLGTLDPTDLEALAAELARTPCPETP